MTDHFNALLSQAPEFRNLYLLVTESLRFAYTHVFLYALLTFVALYSLLTFVFALVDQSIGHALFRIHYLIVFGMTVYFFVLSIKYEFLDQSNGKGCNPKTDICLSSSIALVKSNEDRIVTTENFTKQLNVGLELVDNLRRLWNQF